MSEDNADLSEANAKASEDAAKASELQAKAHADSIDYDSTLAQDSAAAAKVSEDNAKVSEDNAEQYAIRAENANPLFESTLAETEAARDEALAHAEDSAASAVTSEYWAGEAKKSEGATGYTKDEVDAMLDALDAVPAGLISIWSGSLDALPEDWTLCDGTNGAPDLRDKFVVGAGSTYAVDATGGSKDAVVVSHNHTVTINEKTGLTGWWDFKNRGGSSYATPILANSSGGKCTHTNRSNSGSYGEGYRGEGGSGSSRANLNVNHNHSGTVASKGVAGTDKNLPPYFALCYIMKLPKGTR